MEHVYQNKSPRVFQFPNSHLSPHFLDGEHDLLQLNFHYEPPKQYICIKFIREICYIVFSPSIRI